MKKISSQTWMIGGFPFLIMSLVPVGFKKPPLAIEVFGYVMMTIWLFCLGMGLWTTHKENQEAAKHLRATLDRLQAAWQPAAYNSRQSAPIGPNQEKREIADLNKLSRGK